MRIKKAIAVTSLAAIVLALAGCGAAKPGAKEEGQTDAPKAPAIDTSPVKLRVYITNSSISDQDLETLIGGAVKQKFPYISLQPIRIGKGTTIEELIASGEIPDIIYSNAPGLGSYKTLNLLEDMTPLLKKHQIDLSRFTPVMLDPVRALSDKGELYGLPFFAHFSALYYNKDIFDKFGVAYPKDGMTWEEVTEIGKALSRTDSGIQYKGLDPDTIPRLGMQLSLTTVDAKTNKASINSDGWRKVFTLGKEIWSIPNNKPEKLNSFNSRNWFMKDRNIAMLPINNIMNIGLEEASKNGLNWDVVQYPSYNEKPNVDTHVDPQIFAVTKSSKYKDQAMQVLSVAMSDEVQLKSARTTARLSTLKNPEMKSQFLRRYAVPEREKRAVHFQKLARSRPRVFDL
jgi:multiple sugar transport system substrate-binding protein